MANVKRWSYSGMNIKWGKGTFDQIRVDSAIMDAEVQCFHCGKNIKSGKLVFCAHSFFGGNPFEKGDSSWGEDTYRATFCSSNHAKLFAKNKNGL
jgi:hypothetical protein